MAAASLIAFSNPSSSSLLSHTRRVLNTRPTSCCSTISAVALKPTATSAADPKIAPSLSAVWREIQGCDDWRNLLQPLHPLLRHEIVRYGEFVAACYKAFDLDPASKRYLKCKHGRRSMLRDLGMAACGYELTRYVYATPDVATGRSRWVGFVAVSTDDESLRLGRRDVLVAFRGTATNSEWMANLMSSLVPARLNPHDPRPDVQVESGFLGLYTARDAASKFGHGSAREQLLRELSRIVAAHKNEELSITLAGHSMGSAIAMLAAYDVAELGLNRDQSGRRAIAATITVVSFGGPRVGNAGFKKRCEELGVKALRVANAKDPVTKIPGVFFNEGSMPWSGSCYAHVGVELGLDFFETRNPKCVHDLDAYLRLLNNHNFNDNKGNNNNDQHNSNVGVYNLLSKVKELVGKQSVEGWPWQDAAIQLGNFVQALGM